MEYAVHSIEYEAESKILLQMLIYKNIVFSFENSFEK